MRQVNARSRPGYLQHGKSLKVEGERSVTCAQDYTDDAAYLGRSIDTTNSRDASKDTDLFPTRFESDISVEVVQFILICLRSRKKEA